MRIEGLPISVAYPSYSSTETKLIHNTRNEKIKKKSILTIQGAPSIWLEAS